MGENAHIFQLMADVADYLESIMQALITSYVPPTNTRGTRVKVTTATGSKTYTWDHGVDAQANHIRAATAHAKALGWVKSGDQMAFGSIPRDAGYACVILTADSEITVEI